MINKASDLLSLDNSLTILYVHGHLIERRIFTVLPDKKGVVSLGILLSLLYFSVIYTLVLSTWFSVLQNNRIFEE